MKYNHKVFDILHMFHVLVWDKNTCDLVYLTHVHPVVYCESHKTVIQETGFWHNKFSRADARHFYYVAHDTPCLSTFFS